MGNKIGFHPQSVIEQETLQFRISRFIKIQHRHCAVLTADSLSTSTQMQLTGILLMPSKLRKILNIQLSKTTQNVQPTIHPTINSLKENFSDTQSKLASMHMITNLFLSYQCLVCKVRSETLSIFKQTQRKCHKMKQRSMSEKNAKKNCRNNEQQNYYQDGN